MFIPIDISQHELKQTVIREESTVWTIDKHEIYCFVRSTFASLGFFVIHLVLLVVLSSMSWYTFAVGVWHILHLS